MNDKYDSPEENPRFKDVKEDFDVARNNQVAVYVTDIEDLEDCAEAFCNLAQKELADELEYDGPGDYLFDFSGAWLTVEMI